MPSSSVKHRAACREGNTWGHSRLLAAQSAGAQAHSLHSPDTLCTRNAHSVLWRSLESRTDATLEGSQFIKEGCCVMGTRCGHPQNGKSIAEFSSYFTTLPPPSNRSLCSMTDSFLSYMKTNIRDGRRSRNRFSISCLTLPLALCSIFPIFKILVLNYITALVAIIFFILE